MTVVAATKGSSAPPSAVRAAFLDWPDLTTWDKSYMTSLTPLAANSPLSPPSALIPDKSKTGLTVQAGDKVHGTFWGGEAILEILENSEDRMRWKGTWKGLVAVRTFEYVSDGKNGTAFTQSEEAEGFMGFVLKADGWAGENLRKKFVKFNEDLKGYCEKK